MNDLVIRENIVQLLQGNQAHMSLEDAVKGFPETAMNTIFPNGTYSSWHLLEHIRFTQFDILDFMINPKYQEPEWPKDYWPKPKETATIQKWKNTLAAYKEDLEKLKQMVMDKHIDLSAKVPNGNGQTYIREFLLVADHTAYHVGEFGIMRQTLDTWSK